MIEERKQYPIKSIYFTIKPLHIPVWASLKSQTKHINWTATDLRPQVVRVCARVGAGAVEPEPVDGPVVGQHFCHHANLAPDKLRATVVRDRVHVAVVLHIQVVADLDVPTVGRVRKLAQHVALAPWSMRTRNLLNQVDFPRHEVW